MKKYIVSAIVLLAVGGISFYVGYAYSENKNSLANFQANMGENFKMRVSGQNLPEGARSGSRMMLSGGVAGEITAVDNQSITVKLSDGSSKIVFYSDSTAISKQAEGSKDDLTIGVQIMISGQQNTDGSYAASAIRIGDLLWQRQ